MTIYTGGGQVRRGMVLEDFPAPLSDVLGVTAEEAWLYSPTSSADRLAELQTAERGLPEFEPEPDAGGFLGGSFSRRGPTSRVVPAEDARERVKAEGLDLQIPDSGIPEDALTLIMERKREAMRRQDVLNRAPGGFTPGLLRFGTTLGVSMLDPLNVAASFIPIVGPARYGRMLEQAGSGLARAGVRARVGALEGAVGAAVVEPLVLSAATAEQADYDMADSLLNLAFGTVMGGGLHMGVGAAGDALSKGHPWWQSQPQGDTARSVADWSPQERAQVTQIALAQAMSGRAVDVEPWVAVRNAVADVRPSTIAEARKQVLSDVRQEIEQELTPLAGNKLSRGEVKQLTTEKADLERRMEALDNSFKETAKRLQRDRKLSRKRAETEAKQAINSDRVALRDRLNRVDTTLRANEASRAAEADLSRLEQGIVPDRYMDRIESEAQRRATEGQFPERALASAVRRGLGQPEAQIGRAWDGLRKAATRQDAPEADPLADFRAAQMTLEDLKTAPAGTRAEVAQQLVDEAEEAVNDLAKQLDLDLKAELAPFDEAIKTAESMGAALRALARCQARVA